MKRYLSLFVVILLFGCVQHNKNDVLEKVLSDYDAIEHNGNQDDGTFIYVLFTGKKGNYKMYTTRLHSGSGSGCFEHSVGFLYYRENLIYVENYTDSAVLPFSFFPRRLFHMNKYPKQLLPNKTSRISDPLFRCYNIYADTLEYLYNTEMIDWENSHSIYEMPLPPPKN